MIHVSSAWVAEVAVAMSGIAVLRATIEAMTMSRARQATMSSQVRARLDRSATVVSVGWPSLARVSTMHLPFGKCDTFETGSLEPRLAVFFPGVEVEQT